MFVQIINKSQWEKQQHFSKMQGIIKDMECYLGSFQAHFAIIPTTTKWFFGSNEPKVPTWPIFYNEWVL